MLLVAAAVAAAVFAPGIAASSLGIVGRVPSPAAWGATRPGTTPATRSPPPRRGCPPGGSRPLEQEHGQIASITGDMIAQRARVAEVARLTGETVTRMDAGANGIGRVSSAASVVRVLARQIGRAAPAQPAS